MSNELNGKTYFDVDTYLIKRLQDSPEPLDETTVKILRYLENKGCRFAVDFQIDRIMEIVWKLIPATLNRDPETGEGKPYIQ